MKTSKSIILRININNKYAILFEENNTIFFIDRFEKLSEEGELFLEYLNRSSQVETRWANSHGTGSSSTTELACKYYSQLSVSLIKKIIAKYWIDFKMFNYPSDLYTHCAKDYVDGSNGAVLW